MMSLNSTDDVAAHVWTRLRFAPAFLLLVLFTFDFFELISVYGCNKKKKHFANPSKTNIALRSAVKALLADLFSHQRDVS